MLRISLGLHILLQDTLEIYHHWWPLNHRLREGLQTGMRLTLVIVIHHIIFRLEPRHHSNSISLRALVRKSWPSTNRQNVWRSILLISFVTDFQNRVEDNSLLQPLQAFPCILLGVLPGWRFRGF